jgi:hypothetical protein
LESLLIERLSDFLEPSGFVWQVAYSQFRREHPGGFANIIVSSVAEETQLVTQVNIGVRVEAVEQRVQPFLGTLQDFRPEANTVIVSLGKLSGKPYLRWKSRNTEEVQQSVAEIFSMMQTLGVPLLNELSDNQRLHQQLNAVPALPHLLFHNQTHYCFKAPVLAFLLQDSGFEELTSIYRRFLRQLHPPQTVLDKYEILLRELKQTTLN